MLTALPMHNILLESGSISRAAKRYDGESRGGVAIAI